VREVSTHVALSLNKNRTFEEKAKETTKETTTKEMREKMRE
jgi:hypothetical protein